MADITANVDAWSSTEASNSPSGSTTIGPGLDDNLRAIQAGVKLLQARWPFAGALVINGKITRSVGSSALTIALKGNDGNDPSSTNKVYVLVPSLTSNVFDGGYSIIEVTSALSFVVSSGSTLGHTSAVAAPVHIYLINNAGSIELAASTKFFGGMSVQTTTAEGGAGASDSATTLYSTTARSNVATLCLQRWKSTQTTAGTWAATSGEVQLYPFPYKKPKVTKFTSNGTFTKDWDALWAELYVKGGGGSGGGSSSGTAQGGGGGEGEEAWRTLDSSDIGGQETVTIGAGGTGINISTNANGNAGNTTSIGSLLTAAGGSGGTTGNNGGLGGAGGTGGSNSDLAMPGAAGHKGTDTGATLSIAASGGGKGGAGPGTGAVANSGGGGGSGSTGAGSGAGGSGVALVTEHYSEGA